MAYALVGSVGAVSGPNNGVAATPAWGTSETRAAGNLLICWYVQDGVTTLPTTPAGWSVAISTTNATGSVVSMIFYKIATGGDAAPTITPDASASFLAMLGEFSGGATVSPLDRTAVAAGAATPIVATAAGADVAAGELIITSAFAFYSTAATKTNTNTYNNGATANSTNNNASSVTFHYDFAWGITTGNSAADSDSFAFSTTKITNTILSLASFKLASAAPLLPSQLRRAPRQNRPARQSRGRFMVAFPKLWTPKLWLPAGA